MAFLTDEEAIALMQKNGYTQDEIADRLVLLRTHREAAERDCEAAERERERDIAMFKLLPRVERNTRFAENDALAMEKRGMRIDRIEARLFDGLPRDASWRAVRRLAREVQYENLATGTRALLAAQMDALEIAESRGPAAAARKIAEADAFGQASTKSWLSMAGVDQENLQ